MTATSRIEAAFSALSSFNEATLADLRDATNLPRDEFDAALRALRIARKLTAYAIDGRHGQASARELEAGIREEGSTLSLVARIEDEEDEDC